jgi:hypothetical protein
MGVLKKHDKLSCGVMFEKQVKTCEKIKSPIDED